MSGAVRPAWAPEVRAGLCQMLRDQLVETINAIRSEAAVVAPAPDAEPVGERPIRVAQLFEQV